MTDRLFDLGLLGLGVMGSALAQNIMEHGFYTALYSVSKEERKRFSGVTENYRTCESLEEFVHSLEKPRIILLMITAGNPVDEMIQKLLPLLDKGDIILDGGNSYYKDTAERGIKCASKGIEYMGIGISGGEKGARFGPSIMAGGSKHAWQEVQPILNTVAAFHDGKPCCGYIAEGGAGHYVKMLHNGIEYAILQLIAETYQFMRFGQGKKNAEIQAAFEKWNRGKLNSYLIEISSKVLKKTEGGTPLIDLILDVAEQKGTGRWTVAESVERGVYIPAVYEAQMARVFSGKVEERKEGAKCLPLSPMEIPELSEEELENALLLSVILAYSQGFELIKKAAEEEGWKIDLQSLAGLWNDGCIIRSALLEQIEKTEELTEKPLLLSEEFSYIGGLEIALRKTVSASVLSGIAMPCFCASLNYYDYYRMESMPVNFIQALRDCFGSHTYMRRDRKGHFHTVWDDEE